jgi:acyl dehydratase
MFSFDSVIGHPASERTFDYTARDAALYALSTGLGASEQELPFVLEEQLTCVPTFALIPGHFLPWLRDPATGLDRSKMLHGETGLAIHAPLPPAGSLRVRQQVTGVVDRGPGQSVSVFFEQAVRDAPSDRLLATVTGSFVFPGAGVQARSAGQRLPTHEVPGGAPDLVASQPLPGTAALLYRLTGDRNLLHVAPAAARAAGFDAPILHGLCTFGHAGAAALRTLCGLDGSRLRALSARYRSPTYPGDVLRTEFFAVGPGAYAFRCIAANRSTTVIDSGRVLVEASR